MQVRYRTAPTAPNGSRLAAADSRPGQMNHAASANQMFESRTYGYETLMTEHTNPSGATRDAEKAAAGHAHDAGRAATEDEERLADSNTVDPRVAQHEREMLERGASQRGEGR